MKQTKPFGRAYIPAAERMAASAAEAPAPQVAQPPAAEQPAYAGGPGDLYSVDAVFVPYVSTAEVDGWGAMARAAVLWAVLGVGAVTGYVLVRDSMVLQSLLQQVTTEDTVMVCKDGKMVYDDYSVVDRLLNNGRFLCTEWKVQRGFLTLPRH